MSRRSLICLPPSPPNHNSPFISYHFSATGENPSSGDPSCCASPTVPRSPPGHSGLRSESSYLNDIRLHPRVPFRKQEADPTECWASNPKSERRTHRTPDTPNFRPRVSDIREPVTGRLWLHLRRMGQSPALQRLGGGYGGGTSLDVFLRRL